MKLTGDTVIYTAIDLEDTDVKLSEIDPEVRKQILSNQEKAKELDEIRKTGLIFTDREWVQDQLKQLREKAEIYDRLFPNGNHEDVDLAVKHILEENKQLKEKLGIALADQHCNNDVIISLEHERDEMKEIVERAKTQHNEMDIFRKAKQAGTNDWLIAESIFHTLDFVLYIDREILGEDEAIKEVS